MVGLKCKLYLVPCPTCNNDGGNDDGNCDDCDDCDDGGGLFSATSGRMNHKTACLLASLVEYVIVIIGIILIIIIVIVIIIIIAIVIIIIIIIIIAIVTIVVVSTGPIVVTKPDGLFSQYVELLLVSHDEQISSSNQF